MGGVTWITNQRKWSNQFSHIDQVLSSYEFSNCSFQRRFLILTSLHIPSYSYFLCSSSMKWRKTNTNPPKSLFIDWFKVWTSRTVPFGEHIFSEWRYFIDFKTIKWCVVHRHHHVTNALDLLFYFYRFVVSFKSNWCANELFNVQLYIVFFIIIYLFVEGFAIAFIELAHFYEFNFRIHCRSFTKRLRRYTLNMRTN